MLLPTPPPSTIASTSLSSWSVKVMLRSWLQLGPHHLSGSWYNGVDLCDRANGFGPPLPEDHPRPWLEELWVLNETKVAIGLVSCS